MRSWFVKSSALALTFASATIASIPYSLDDADLYQGNTFFNKFSFSLDRDQSHGFVQYISRSQANSTDFGSKLVDYYPDGSVYIGVDTTNTYTVTPGRTGRASVRLESNAVYTHGLFIVDIAHMPGSICGLWPAFWTTNKANWPNSGEIDIIENIHENTVGTSTFHTSDSRAIACSVVGNQKGKQQTGTQTTYNCNDKATFSNYGSQYSGQGCSATNTDPNSYGKTFNAAGGGVYAMEWTNTSIKVWNWERGNIPADITLGVPIPDTWGLPVTFTDITTCAIDKAFSQHQIIFNTDFCGDWGNQSTFWQQTSCYKNNPTKYASCETYVGANPQAYAEAYWRVNSLKVYKQTNLLSGLSTSSTTSPFKDVPTSPTFYSSTTSTTSSSLKFAPSSSSTTMFTSSLTTSKSALPSSASDKTSTTARAPSILGSPSLSNTTSAVTTSTLSTRQQTSSGVSTSVSISSKSPLISSPGSPRL
ncbi:uncharacterized protein LY89DRAFT_735062 [Mollisia scopiformis]|uniref:GH16 domain-containing protein n=1 Tax=Mollisia scopiformis TaxID=149040 RepID=A0A194X762_MOLSC|nr:uncharacterized protein LY89DRAFT_735062 [Mollisia scopiformis]KUJ15919.1 hypothetical protein LY89DRAFT_735062 [Mollisia scopiformis]